MPAVIDKNSTLGRINDILKQIQGEKQAAAKKATEMGLSGSAADDPGSVGGTSSHPTADADSGAGKAPLGERGKENEEDVKEVFPAAVDATTPGEGGSQEDHTQDIGMRLSATGEDPSVEDNSDHAQPDPGTTHSSPAEADKTAADYQKMAFDPLVKLAFDKMNGVLKEIGDGADVEKKASPAKPAKPGAPATQAPPTSAQTRKAAEAGYQTAGTGLDKKAAAQAMIERALLEAEADADRVGRFLVQHQAARAKQAAFLKKQAEGEPMPMPPPPPGGGGMPPPGMDGGQLPPEAYAGGGGAPPPDAGGAPPPGEAPPGGGEDHQAALEELGNALQEANIDPQEIIELVKSMGQGGGANGAPPPAGGERPPASPAEKEARTKMAASLKSFPKEASHLAGLCKQVVDLRDKGKLRLKAARSPEGRSQRDEIKHWVRNICGVR